MVKRKATQPAAGAGRRAKRANTTSSPPTFFWKPKDWIIEKAISDEVTLLRSNTTHSRLVIKKVMRNSRTDNLPIEVRTLRELPSCSRIVQPVLFLPSDPDAFHSTALFDHYPLGDLLQWKEACFDQKNKKPVTESHIWRCFLQIGQALAFLQKAGRGVLHRDLKPHNILVTDNGTTYPSFKLHDFGVATTYQRSRARHPSRCGSFQFQPPENPLINTKAAETWGLGACIHFLVVGQPPIEVLGPAMVRRYRENGNQHPASAQDYSTVAQYYSARVPRRVTPINLSKQEQRTQGIGPYAATNRAPFNHQYSDELNDWMMKALRLDPRRRPNGDRLVRGLEPVARRILRRMGGIAALSDLEVEISV
ncbi:serine/threonine protein kinase-like protein [Massariosphaeria phaeospora]|uniref:non-specific serine/threonine protein kinase n=1 Tax=Massariosphaeria phaeospora TaxID=100035 RepID=A0A7C8IA46_9PLEO|nr:serine/threonine protein kinase-like protein [Massariosphaeria phaeospora]